MTSVSNVPSPTGALTSAPALTSVSNTAGFGLYFNASISGVSPFTEVYGEDCAGGLALHREQGPNMRVVKCKEFVSLREARSTSAKRLAKVPLGALVLAFPEYGEENGFIYCVYHDEEGFILAEYLSPAD